MPDPQHTSDSGDPRLDALIEWRQQLIDSGAVSKSSFKETHLRLILRSGRTDIDQVRAMLPGAVADHAEEVAAILAQAPTPPESGSGRHQRRRPAPSSGSDDDADIETTTIVSAAKRAATEPARPQQGALSAEDFALLEFDPQSVSAQAGELETIAIEAVPGNGEVAVRELWWHDYLPDGGTGAAVVIYRLVAAEDSAPYAPERARLVAATTTTNAVDELPAGAAVRHYQVWVNIGESRTKALAAQPIKHAEAVAVTAVRDYVIREDSGRVTARWTVPAGVGSVFVFRIPAEETGRERPHHRILARQDNLDGFVDVDAEPGRSYVYRVRAAAQVDGLLLLSEAVEAAVDVTAVLAAVTDLSATGAPAGDVFELSWTPPAAGEVAIYRTERGPNAGADGTELPEASLEQIGLDVDARLNQPVLRQREEQGHQKSVMPGVSWPSGWSRAYFTPVTTTSGRALVGTTFSTVRTGVIRDVDLAEYCNKQVLTFDWPKGSAAVVVYLAPKGYDARNGLTGTSFEISAEEYDKYGGLQLESGKLPLTGCSLHLAPVAFSGGRRMTGAVRSIEYAGLLRLQYAVQLVREPDGSPSHATIYLRSQVPMPGSPPFVLVNNPDRIPLSPSDGEAVDAAPLDASGALSGQPSKELRWSALTTTGTEEPWAVNLRGRRGWIRLFVNAPSALRLSTIALLDPPARDLRLTVGQR
jgi:hypothetical protein